jgi:Skp family chaperone for outer membrane proteins
MIRSFLCYLVLLATLEVAAQTPASKTSPSYSPEKCTAAYYNRDSVALKMQGFRPWYDSINNIYIRKNELQKKYFLATDRYLMAAPDSGEKLSEQQQSEYNSAKKETEMLDAQIHKLNEQMGKVMSERMTTYYDSIQRAAGRIAKQRNIEIVFEIGENRQMFCPTDQMLMIDITNDISVSLGQKPHLLRVGVFNTDSLLRLMPGYSKMADSTVADMKIFNDAVAKKDAEIAKMQHELDSLRPTLSNKKIKDKESQIAAKQEERDIYRGYELYKVDLKDSLRTSSYRKKLRSAAAEAAKDAGCLKYYDSSIAHDYWTTDEAEFVDLNASIARKLYQ